MNDELSTDELAQMRERAENATPGPWEARGFDSRSSREERANAEFIARARTDVPRLLDALEAERAEVKQLRALDAQFPCDGGCNYNTGPEEQCTRHGRSASELWAAVDEIRAQRDELRAERDRWKERWQSAVDDAQGGSEEAMTDPTPAMKRAAAWLYPSFDPPEERPLEIARGVLAAALDAEEVAGALYEASVGVPWEGHAINPDCDQDCPWRAEARTFITSILGGDS